jgi:hypothetical protein
MSMALLQAPVGAWWTTGAFWLFIVLFAIVVFLLLPYAWRSPRRRR